MYSSKYSFYGYYNIKKLNSFSLKSKYLMLLLFCRNLIKFNNLNPQKESTKKKNVTVHCNASKLCNEYLEVYFDE